MGSVGFLLLADYCFKFFQHTNQPLNNLSVNGEMAELAEGARLLSE